MRADFKTLSFWRKLKDHGDIKDIAEQLNLSRITVGKILRGNATTVDNIIKINQYFMRKQEKLKQSML